MRNILFFLYHRGGSHLFLETLLDRSMVAYDNAQKEYTVEDAGKVYTPGAFLCTSPPEMCEAQFFFNPADIRYACREKPVDLHAWYTYIGEWWGARERSCDVPGPYEGFSETRWGTEDLQKLPGDDWKFVLQVRDPRNHIESIRWTPGEKKNPHQIRDHRDYFTTLCKNFRNRLRVALDCQQAIGENYKITRYEDLKTEPLKTMEGIFDFIALPPDLERLEKTIRLEQQAHVADDRSTFKLSSKDDKRWHNWTPEEVEIFKQTLNRELVELSYESNSNWELP